MMKRSLQMAIQARTSVTTKDERIAPPRAEHDGRVMIWFFSWLGGFFLCSGGFVLLIFASPRVMKLIEEQPAVFFTCIILGLACLAMALAPWYRGIRCRNCRRRLYRMAVECDRTTGNTPLWFYCETCHMIWKTGLISGPGSPNNCSSH